MKRIVPFIATIGLGLSVIGLQARHIIGGDLTYDCTGIDTVRNVVSYRITMKIYRDCYGGGAPFDVPAIIGVYEKRSTGNYVFVSRVDISPSNISRINPDLSNPCLVLPPNICVEEGVYVFGISLPISNFSYYFAYQRCCRNETISNIVAPGDQGAAFTLEITPEAQRLCNNSPKFKNFPPTVICVNQPLDFDHSASDMEGDVVTYEFCTPLTAGGKRGSPELPGTPTACDGVTPDPTSCRPPFQLIRFGPLYSAGNPMGGNPQIGINGVTGLISGTPRIQGQYVVGVCIKEFRNGVLLSEIRRDFQFNVAFCSPKVQAILRADSVINNKKFIINSCGRNTINFENLSIDPNFIREYHWEFPIQNRIDSFNSRNVTITFPGVGTYTGTMMLNRGTVCADTAEIHVNIFPSIHAGFSYSYDTCVAGPIAFTDQSFSGAGPIQSWRWQFEPNQGSALQNPTYTYSTPGRKAVRLLVTDANGCIDDSIAQIPYFPVPPLLIVAPSHFVGCAPSEVFFNNLSMPIDSSYDISWDFGDNGKSNKISPTHRYLTAGIYTVRLTVKSPIGCVTQASFDSWIEIREAPEARFTYSPKKLNSLKRDVVFTDQSLRNVSREWYIENNHRLTGAVERYFFKDTGVHEVMLIAIHQNGCRDTTVQYIDVEPIVTFHMPNAFTPNGDGKNEIFKGQGIFEGMKEFEFSIWDRWGSLVFNTSDPEGGWNGRWQNTGSNLPNGVYVYRVQYQTPRQKWIRLEGFATLIR